MTRPRRIVYTAIIGGYEELLEQPVAAQSDLEFVCFTDSDDVTSDTWRIVRIEPAFASDPVRSARTIKILGVPELSEYDETLWIDNSVLLRVPPEHILDTWLAGSPFALPRHSYRNRVVAEFEEVLRSGFDDSSRVYEQLLHYSADAPQLLEAPALWTAILARRPHDEAVRVAMTTWYRHVLRYSRRDQLSIVTALGDAGLEPHVIELDNRESELHEWPVASRHLAGHPLLRLASTLQAPVGRIGALELELDQMVRTLNGAVADRERRIGELEREVAGIRSSRSWRVARALSRLRPR